jgi:hypothetical protein
MRVGEGVITCNPRCPLCVGCNPYLTRTQQHVHGIVRFERSVGATCCRVLRDLALDLFQKPCAPLSDGQVKPACGLPLSCH